MSLGRLLRQRFRDLFHRWWVGRGIPAPLEGLFPQVDTARPFLSLARIAPCCRGVQFEKDAKPYLPMVLAGQNNLLDALSYRNAAPLASRVVARSHLEGIGLQQMKQYLEHHLAIAGVSNLFDENAVTAIQGSGGLLREANHLARGALTVAAKTKNPDRWRRTRAPGGHLI